MHIRFSCETSDFKISETTLDSVGMDDLLAGQMQRVDLIGILIGLGFKLGFKNQIIGTLVGRSDAGQQHAGNLAVQAFEGSLDFGSSSSLIAGITQLPHYNMLDH